MSPGMDDNALKKEIGIMVSFKAKGAKNFKYRCTVTSDISTYAGRIIKYDCQVETDIGIVFNTDCEVSGNMLGGGTSCWH